MTNSRTKAKYEVMNGAPRATPGPLQRRRRSSTRAKIWDLDDQIGSIIRTLHRHIDSVTVLAVEADFSFKRTIGGSLVDPDRPVAAAGRLDSAIRRALDDEKNGRVRPL